MAKKQFFMIVDTETTNDNQVFDFAAIIVDREGNIHNQCAIIVADNMEKELFSDPSGKGLWTLAYAKQKKEKYFKMLDSGQRMMASVNAINRWLEKVNAKYKPTLTAYNIGFDSTKCANTGIDLTIFESRFCLWHTAANIFAAKKQYKQFALENLYFNDKTEYGNMTIQTNAEKMAHYITGRKNDEPHTALEDAIYFELPILIAVLKKRNWKEFMGTAYNWRDYQVKDHFQAK